MTIRILEGDCRKVLQTLSDECAHAIVTDPPYHLTNNSGGPHGRGKGTPYSRSRAGAGRKGFMGKAWDGGDVAFRPDTWRECLRVLKPGGYLLAFGGTRTFHRLACAIEDAGFEIRDRIRFECSPESKYGPLWESLNPEQRDALLELLNDQAGLGSELAWIYSSGFPKSLDVSKAIDRSARADREGTGQWVRGGCRAARDGAELVGSTSIEAAKWRERTKPATDAARIWSGWGTALRPAHEPIIVARKPLSGTVAKNVLSFGTGALNINGCRTPCGKTHSVQAPATNATNHEVAPLDLFSFQKEAEVGASAEGRWPTNFIHDGSDGVLAAFPHAPGQLANAFHNSNECKGKNVYRNLRRSRAGEASADSSNQGPVNFKMRPGMRRLDSGSAARFFYCAKASKADRGEGNTHPTVKPVALMRYLLRLVTPPGGTVLDPFAGSGSTGVAADIEGFDAILVEAVHEHVEIIRRRLCNDAPLLATKRIAP